MAESVTEKAVAVGCNVADSVAAARVRATLCFDAKVVAFVALRI